MKDNRKADTFVDADELKNEAIKWVKEWQHDHSDFSRGRQNGLIIFCNITSEDLK